MLFRKSAPQYVLKTIDSDASVVSQKVSRKKSSLVIKITAAAAALGLAALLGVSFAPVPTTPTATADMWTDGFCGNPGMDDIPAAGNWGSSMLAGANLPMDKNGYSEMISNMSGKSGGYTGFEWYSSAPLTWDYNSWGELELAHDCAGLAAAKGTIPSMLLSINTFVSNVIIGVMGGVTTSNFIQAWFLDTPDSGLPLVIKNLKDSLFLNYLAPIVLLSAVGLAWNGLVKKRSRESIQGVIWMFAASAAALSFMVNPVWFAKTFDGVVTTTSNWVVSSMASASTPANGDFCSAGFATGNAVDGASVDDSMRTMQCNLWVSFSLIPWYSGYVGDLSSKDIKVVGDGDGAASTFRGSNTLVTALLDVKGYNRATGMYTEDSLNAPGQRAAIEAKRAAQWTTIQKTLEAQSSDTKLSGLSDNIKGYWSGEDTAGRTSIAISALVAQLIALFPIAVLAIGMMFQQIAFILLMAISPIFLTMGIHPGRGRKFALGWLEMVLGTGLKRILLAGFLGLTLVYFNIVMSNSGAMFGITDAVGAGLIAGGLTTGMAGASASGLMMILLTRALVFSIGAIAILSFRKKVLKDAGDLIELNGVRANDGGKSKAFFGGLGSGLLAAGAAGVGTKMGGGSFTDGAKKGYTGPGVSSVPGGSTVGTAMRHKQRQQNTLAAEATRNERAAAAEERKANSDVNSQQTQAQRKAEREEDLRIKKDANKALKDVAKTQEETNRLLRTSLGIDDPSAPIGNIEAEAPSRSRGGPNRPRPTFRDASTDTVPLPDRETRSDDVTQDGKNA